MDKVIALIIAGILLATPTIRAADSVVNAVQWIVPSNSMAAARWPFNWKPPFTIPTNTPAFESHGLEFMLTRANEMRKKWELEIPQPLTVNEVYFATFPTVHGIIGHLMTRDRRFHWSFDRNVLFEFQDLKYHSPSFRYKDEESSKLTKIKSQITKKEAETIARNALYKLFEKNEKQLKMKRSVEVNQYKFEESDGKVYPLPLFDITWRMAGPKQYAADNIEYSPLQMEISGITKSVVSYSHAEYLNLNSPLPRDPLPTNYFQMLGLPNNYLETLPERERAIWGLPPLTNLPPLRINSRK